MTEDQRRLWRARVGLEHRAGRLTRTQRDIALALLRHLSTEGRCDPSYAALAETAGTAARSVGRALAPLKALGLLSWERRLVRKAWPAGGPRATRAEQTSNAYALLLPPTPHAPAQPRPKRLPKAEREGEPAEQLRPEPGCDGQNGREIPPQYSIEAQLALLGPLTEADRYRLQVLRATRQAKWAEDWHAKRQERWRSRA